MKKYACVVSTCQWAVSCSECGFYSNGRGAILSFSASSEKKKIRKLYFKISELEDFKTAELEDFSSSVFSLPLMTVWVLNLPLCLLK